MADPRCTGLGIDGSMVTVMRVTKRPLRIARTAALAGIGVLAATSIAIGAWSGTYDVSTGSGDARNPRLAVDAGGAVTAVWVQKVGADRAVYASRYTPGAWSAPVPLSAPASDNDWDGGYVDVAARASGQAIATWARFDGSKDVIQAALYSGGAWSSAVTVSSNSQNAVQPKVAIDGSGNAIVVWREWNGAEWNVMANRYTGSWSGPTQLSLSGNSSGEPAVALNAAGDGVAGWSRSNGMVGVIQVRRLVSGSWGPTANLTDGACCNGAGGIRLAINSANTAVAVWQFGNASPRAIQSSRWNGSSWTTRADISGGVDATDPQIVVDGGGEFTAMWRNDASARAARLSGGTWSSPVVVNGERRPTGQIGLAAGGSGNAMAVWTGYRDSDSSRILQVSRYASGAWSAPTDLFPVDGYGAADSPVAAMDGSNVGTIAWAANTGTQSIIRAVADDGTAGNSAGDTPTVSVVASTTTPLTGQSVTFTAAATVPAGTVSQYAWDLDGDGSFETNTSSPQATTSYGTAGARTVTVRATAPRGASSTATVGVTAYLAPPSGEPGISINGANPYTNDPNVTLRVVWPPFATSVRLSNDGGFTGATTVTRDLAATYPWALDTSVKALHTKIVYMRFSGLGVDESKTYTDDIVLDLTPPEVISARARVVSSSTEKGESARKKKPKRRIPTVRVQVNAKDRLSGVEMIQVTDRKAVPGKVRDYATITKLRTKKKRVFVRVQDGAGNWSNWESARVR